MLTIAIKGQGATYHEAVLDEAEAKLTWLPIECERILMLAFSFAYLFNSAIERKFLCAVIWEDVKSAYLL